MARILIVDDEKENLDSLKRALGDLNPGWIIMTAPNEIEGKKLLENQLVEKQPIDVVLTDLVMENEQSGMNILQEAWKLDPQVMTILFTAKEKNLDRYAALDIGAFDVVEKNIRGSAAVREINLKTRAALRYRQSSNRIHFLRKYFDPKVFDIIEKDPSLLSLKTRTLTIVFWDIRGFSRLCESLKAYPELIAGFLKDYSETSAKIIFTNGGVLDKFIGDGVMALFGVLNHKDDQGKIDATAAVKAAVSFRTLFQQVEEKWQEQWQLYVPDKIEIGLGCGIHTGEVLAGNFGTEFRDQFTAVGPHVNFASRIEARSLPGQILISQSTCARVKELFPIEKTGEISDIKNIPGVFNLYEVKNK